MAERVRAGPVEAVRPAGLSSAVMTKRFARCGASALSVLPVPPVLSVRPVLPVLCVVCVLSVSAAIPPVLAAAEPVSAPKTAGPTMAEVLAAAAPSDWRPLDPENTLYVTLPTGRVVIELAPEFAPRHVANIKALVREGYFDGLSIIRAQDNYVVQWGDPDDAQPRPVKTAERALAPEFTRPAKGLAFVPLPDRDTYARETGFVSGFPAARDGKSGAAWLTHCYGMVGVARDVGADTGSGTGLYVVIGHAPRHLDRNITLVGRVVRGMQWLSALPRGTGNLGFYETPEQHVPLTSIRVAADLPAAERAPLELLRTDTHTFAALVASRRHRREEWYKVPAGKIDVCNVPLPVREK